MLNTFSTFLRKNCSMTSSDAERWISLIKSTYPENIPFPQSKIVVCDRHFNQECILALGKKKQLIPGSVCKCWVCGFYIISISKMLNIISISILSDILSDQIWHQPHFKPRLHRRCQNYQNKPAMRTTQMMYSILC